MIAKIPLDVGFRTFKEIATWSMKWVICFRCVYAKFGLYSKSGFKCNAETSSLNIILFWQIKKTLHIYGIPTQGSKWGRSRIGVLCSYDGLRHCKISYIWIEFLLDNMSSLLSVLLDLRSSYHIQDLVILESPSYQTTFDHNDNGYYQ